jgi:hypothetical protein
MRLANGMLLMVLVAGILTGCGGNTATSADDQGNSSQVLDTSADTGSYSSATLGTAYEGALPASSQLVLGTFRLEGTGTAITAEQAKTLLPMWQALQAGSLQSDAETNAVLKQIEGAMTAEQLTAIAAMHLTMEDLGAWTQEQGVDMAPPPGALGGSGGFAPPNGMSEEEMAAMRATAEAGGGLPGEGGFPGEGSPFGNMSEEERAAMRATAEAGGMTFGGGRGPAGTGNGQLKMMATQVVKLLTARAAE